MFCRKLRALNYHSPEEKVPLTKTEDLKPLVVWLEDQKIRHYKIEERKPLRDKEGSEWVSIFRSYLKSLECPYTVEMDLTAVVDWLINVAIRYEFDEVASSNPDIRQGLRQADKNRKLQQGKSPLDIDPSDPTFISGTQELAKILKITSHPDPAILLGAVRIVIGEKLNESVLNEHSAAANQKECKRYSVTAKECGFDLGDPVLDEAAKVLRLLHIQELRHLQTQINELIVAVQAVTANPKTDQSLGQIGR